MLCVVNLHIQRVRVFRFPSFSSETWKSLHNSRTVKWLRRCDAQAQHIRIEFNVCYGVGGVCVCVNLFGTLWPCARTKDCVYGNSLWRSKGWNSQSRILTLICANLNALHILSHTLEDNSVYVCALARVRVRSHTTWIELLMEWDDNCRIVKQFEWDWFGMPETTM